MLIKAYSYESQLYIIHASMIPTKMSITEFALSMETYKGPVYESLSRNVKIAIGDLLETFVSPDDIVLFEYFAMKAEIIKHMGWMHGVSRCVLSNYDKKMEDIV